MSKPQEEIPSGPSMALKADLLPSQSEPLPYWKAEAIPPTVPQAD